MGKKLVFDYTFDASAGTITVNDIYAQKRWQLITNLTDNVVVYQFNDPAFGFSDVSFDYENTTTTVTLAYDTSSMSDTDQLQIFIDEGSTDITVNDRFIDPVSKIRVSNPENLIDTDFEYGLQSTKWETLELTANIPTFFSRSGDFSLTITSMDVTAGSDVVAVVTEETHGLQRGSPLIVQGSADVAADGGFVVSAKIDDNTFLYKAKTVFSATRSIKDTFTQVFPGAIYSGTEFKLSNIGGITTDGATPTSELTVNTVDPTNFTLDTKMALANSFAKSTLEFSTDNVSAGTVSTVTQSYVSATPTGETDDFFLGGVNPYMRLPDPRDAFYFREGTSDITIDTVNDRIIFPSPHDYSSYQALIYVTDTASNTAIGGLSTYRAYYIYVINSTTIELRTIPNASSTYRVNLTSVGSNGGVTKALFWRVFETSYYYGRSYYMFNFRQSVSSITGSSSFSVRIKVMNFNGFNYGGHQYLNESDDMYDFNRGVATYWLAQYWSSNSTYGRLFFGSTTSSYVSQRNYLSDYGYLGRYQDTFRQASFYLPNHGYTNGEVVTVTALTGILPLGITDGGSYKVIVVDDNRVGISSVTGSTIYFRSAGSADLEYQFSQTTASSDRDTIGITGTSLQNGDAVTYSNGGGTTIPGLTDGTTYYVANLASDRFMLSTTPSATASGVRADVPNQGSSTYVYYPTNSIRNTSTTGFTTGDAVRYTTASIPILGLEIGAVYFLRVLSSTEFSLYYTSADAVADTNRVLIFYVGGSGAATFTKYNIVDIQAPVPTGETQSLTADFVGAADGNYAITGLSADQLSFNFHAPNQISARTITVEGGKSLVASLDALRIVDHGFITGDSLDYTETGVSNLSGLVSGTTYYAVVRNKDFLSFAATEEDAVQGTILPLSETGASSSPVTGTITLQPTSIIGAFNGGGLITYTGSSNTLTGEGTSFTSYFNKGDTFFINQVEDKNTGDITGFTSTTLVVSTGHGLTTGDPIFFSLTDDTGSFPIAGIDGDNVFFARSIDSTTFAVHYTETDANAGTNTVTISSAGTDCQVNGVNDAGELIERVIDYVNSDGQITLTEDLPSTGQTDVNYLQRTTLLLRPDGFALHRPYDGGVELIPPTNPDSQMIRQTRKYFRYQSGKGIQVSFAVNFSPTSQIDTFSRNGNVGTIKTRFPHRLSTDLAVTVTGSTNQDDTVGTRTYAVTVVTDAQGNNKFYIDGDYISSLDLFEGRTYRFDMSDASNSGHPLRFSITEDGTHGGGIAYITGVTDNYATNAPGTTGSYIEITVASAAPDLFTYCENHSGMGFSAPTPVDPNGNTKNLWNGSFAVQSVVDAFTFTVSLDGTPSDAQAQGLVEYYVNEWNNSSLRCGLFDDQNGLFFEYDGQTLYCCRKSSIQQISGYANLTFRSGTVTGVDTKFSSQLVVGDLIVIKGQTHKVTRIDSDSVMYIAPSYRGVDSNKVVITKTNITRIPQNEWNLDVCDGTGYTGFNLDIHKIQMAYIDYSWYGAGKVRFGFKDQHGDVRYVHSFVHGNFFTEAYMRSGNVPARYEIENIGQPTYVPALAHWGTSVIMDGRFDADRAYLFNASSNNVSVTGAATNSTNARVETTNTYVYRNNGNNRATIGHALLVQTPDAVLGSYSAGTAVSGAGLPAGTTLALPTSTSVKPYQPYLPSVDTFINYGFFLSDREDRTLLVVDKPPLTTSGSFSSYTLGTAGESINVTKELPLISIRLAPSVDTSAPGFLGEREIINRMQLILNQVSVLSTHACTVRLVLNGQLSTNAWQRVTNPSLSQLILHSSADIISGGLSVYNFEASGGTGTSGRTPVLTTEALGEIATLGNAILGGDNVFPDGPDVLTVVVQLNEDPSTVSASNPFTASGRISWSESQA